MATTYRKLAEEIREAYYKGKPSDDASHSLRYFAEIIATCVAECATEDAYLNSNQGESTYSNNQFISTYKNVAISVDSDGEISSILPATPTSLPNNQEIVSVKVNGSKCMECIPMKAQSSFSQGLIGKPKSMVLYEINGTKVIYSSANPLFNPTSATIKMIGAVSGSDLLTSDLTIPKNYEGRIWDKVMARVLPLKPIQQDLINDSVSNPS